MSKLCKDVLFIILKELKDDGNSLYSCLLVRKAWCEIIIPILWENPWKFFQKKPLFNVIISHLSNEAIENLRSQGIELSTTQQKPLFNYISFCRHLELHELEDLIDYNVEEFNISIIKDEILKIFINRNTKITHLYIPKHFNHQIHLISGAEHCFSELKFLQYEGSNINNQHKSLEGLSRISKSIKKLKLRITDIPKEITEVIKLIEAQKNLNEVKLESKSFCKALEDSWVKHADTIQYLQVNRPITKSFVILTSLEMELGRLDDLEDLEVVHLPALKILRVKLSYTTKNLEYLASLIENTNGNLMAIVITNYYEDYDNKKLVETIYQNCPNLRYFRLLFNNGNVSKLEKLLINCQYLDGLFIDIQNEHFDWNNLFEIIARSSPASLFKFKFTFTNCRSPKVESLSLFFDNWKGRHPIHPMSLQLPIRNPSYYFQLIDEHKKEGTVKIFDWFGPEYSDCMIRKGFILKYTTNNKAD